MESKMGNASGAHAARPMLTTALCCAMQGIGGGLGWSLLPPLMPAIARDLTLSHAMGGVVWGAAPLGIAIASPLGGATVDRFGPRRVASAAMLFGAFACASRAFATGPWSLTAAMFVFGLHVGFTAPAVPKALAEHVPLDRLARANGLALLSYTLGTALTVFTAQTVLAPFFGGWRNTMVFAAIAMVAVAALFFLLAHDRGARNRHARTRDVLALARNGQLLRVAFMQFLLFGGYLALLGILPRALTESGLSPSRVGTALASWLVVAGLANAFGPWLSDRIGGRRSICIAGGLVAGIALSGLALLPAHLAPVCLSVAAIGGGCVAPLLFALPAEIEGVGPERIGAALGLLMLVGQAGGFLLPMLTGALAQAGAMPAALLGLGVLHLAIAIPASGLKRRASAPTELSETRPAAERTLVAEAAQLPARG